MWKRLLHLVRDTRDIRHAAILDGFDPVYELATEAIDEWLSRNPASGRFFGLHLAWTERAKEVHCRQTRRV
jgi:hypothetical protein